MNDLVAHASVLINASRSAVWATLLRPDTITKITPVSEVLAPWRLGEQFSWAFEMAGNRTLVEGVVHRLDEAHLIEYDFGDPHSRDLLHRENVHRVTIELSDEGDATRVSVTQDANISRAAHKHAEGGWRLALNNLKGLVERGC